MFGFQSCSGPKGPDFFCRPAHFQAAGILLRRALPALLCFYLSGPVLAQTDGSATQRADDDALPRITLQISQQEIIAEVAASGSSRSRGLMFRDRLEPDHGMLFVFPEIHQPCFWMKNTLLPLTVAFIDAGGRITSLANMEPQSLEPHCAVAPTLYALEMEQGWFDRHGVRPGTVVRGLTEIQAVKP